jgi:hypothetical protein
MKSLAACLLLLCCVPAFSQFGGAIKAEEDYHFTSEVTRKYTSIEERSPGCYEVRNGSLHGFIDSAGHEIIPCVYDEVTLYNDLIIVTGGSRMGLYDRKGQQLLPVEYQRLMPVKNSNNFIVNKNSLWGIVAPLQKNDNVLVPPQYSEFGCLDDAIPSFSNCTTFYFKKDSLYGAIDIVTNKIIIPAVYSALVSSRTGIYQARKNGRFGYIDAGNDTVVPFIFDDCRPLNVNGLTPVKKGKWGLIDRKGNFVVPPQYDEMFKPKRGFVKVMKDGKNGFLNEAGTEVLPCKYDDIKPHDKDDVFNLFSVQLNRKWALFDKTGKPLTAFVYDRLDDYYYHYILVAKGNHFGLLNKQGKEVLPCEYDKIEFYDDEKKMKALKNNKLIYCTPVEFHS